VVFTLGLCTGVRGQIRYVKGIDLSPGEIEEARRRYEEARSKRKGVAPPPPKKKEKTSFK
jgi:hypothetical protein